MPAIPIALGQAAVEIPPMAKEEVSGCVGIDKDDQGTQANTKESCEIYQEMDRHFGQNSWTRQEGAACEKFFSMVHRVRSLICSYGKEIGEDAREFVENAAGTKKEQKDAVERNVRPAAETIKTHRKFAELIWNRRFVMAAAYKEYEMLLLFNSRSLPPQLLRKEAKCKSMLRLQGEDIEQTHARVAHEIKQKQIHSKTAFFMTRAAASHALAYAGRGSKDLSKYSKTSSQRAIGFGEAKTEKVAAPAALKNGEPVPLDPKLAETMEHEAHGFLKELAQEVGIEVAERAVISRILSKTISKAAGPVICVAIHTFEEKKLPPPLALVGEAVTAFSFLPGLAIIMLSGRIEAENKSQAYYRYWGSKAAENRPLLNKDSKASELKRRFCAHLVEEAQKGH